MNFKCVDESISDLVVNVLKEETENDDGVFTSEVIADLDRMAGSVKAGANPYRQEEVDEHFRKTSQAWREGHRITPRQP